MDKTICAADKVTENMRKGSADMTENTQAGDGRTKVLISFVGNRDPYSAAETPARGGIRGLLDAMFRRRPSGRTDDDEGAVLTIVREAKPDAVFLFPSCRARASSPDNHTEGRAEEIAEILSRREGAPSCRIIPLDTDNPADSDKCYKAFKNGIMEMLKTLDSTVEGGADACDFILNTSSGTQQMNRAGRLYLSVSRVSPEFLRVDDPKHAKDKTRRVHTVPRDMEEEMMLLSSVDRNLASFQFHSITESCAALAERSMLSERRAFARALAEIFGAYELLDMMRYSDALAKLETLSHGFAQSKDDLLSRLPHLPAESIAAALDEQITFLRKVQTDSESENTHNLTDLFFNMQRAYARGNYADVLSRFWRLREGVLYIRLRDKGVTVRNMNANSEAVQRIASMPKYEKNIKHHGAKMSFKGDIRDFASLLIDELGDEEAAKFDAEFKDELRQLKDHRNHTLVAHGMLPVKREDAELCMELGERLIDLIPGGRRACESYPFTPERMRTLADMLKA